MHNRCAVHLTVCQKLFFRSTFVLEKNRSLILIPASHRSSLATFEKYI
uniref:Uncharacterized protein n=1 Tax=Anguilla anguilla TaxID=7936 RepID=A0A0E9PRL3_ANGAN